MIISQYCIITLAYQEFFCEQNCISSFGLYEVLMQRAEDQYDK